MQGSIPLVAPGALMRHFAPGSLWGEAATTVFYHREPRGRGRMYPILPPGVQKHTIKLQFWEWKCKKHYERCKRDPGLLNHSLLTTYYLLLSTTYYLLLTTYYLLVTSYYLLLTTYYLLLTTYYLLLTTYYLLLTTYYLLLTTYY